MASSCWLTRGALTVCLLLAVCIPGESTPSLSDVISSRDADRLSKVLQQAPLADLQTACSVAGGLQLVAKDSPDTKSVYSKVCQYLKQQLKSVETPEDMYYATAAAAALGSSCDVKYVSLKSKLTTLLAADTNTITDTYHIVSSLINIGEKVDNGSVSLAELAERLEKDESLISYGHAFSVAGLVSGGDTAALMDLMEDVVAQADETPDTLYFDGGLSVTSTVLSGLFQLASRGSDKPFLTQAQATKFGNYLVSGKFTSSAHSVWYMLRAANQLASNKVVVPAGLLLSNRKPINAQNPKLTVRLTNIMGGAVGGATVKLVSIVDPAGEKETRNKPFSGESDKISYSIGLVADTTLSGKYKVTLSAEPKGDSPVPDVSVEYSVSVSYSVAVSNAELAIVDKEQGIATKTISLKYPEKASEIPVADHTSKVKMTFALTSKQSGSKVKVHQVFVRLLSQSGEEIFYVAMPTADGTYLFELSVADSAKDFNQRSGVYAIDLILGDSATENSLQWSVGSITLTFPGNPTEASSDDQYRYKPRPEIKHVFNKPEKRPPAAVSSGFTILVLVPLLVLLAMWLMIGVNLSGLGQSGVWGLLFHAGLIGIFALYYMFWVRLNMFQTLKYLIIVGGVTFVAGNRLLRRVAQKA